MASVVLVKGSRGTEGLFPERVQPQIGCQSPTIPARALNSGGYGEHFGYFFPIAGGKDDPTLLRAGVQSHLSARTEVLRHGPMPSKAP